MNREEWENIEILLHPSDATVLTDGSKVDSAIGAVAFSYDLPMRKYPTMTQAETYGIISAYINLIESNYEGKTLFTSHVQLSIA
ncbi:hypothetical protein Bhyg_11789 [Pseudolycoriella hygida]|uniref:Uncharacterized protein n=1 Tax=Pseudolycoriella hygida TaxID=35572 RepID=A0A9Q0MXT0_9DIPT|nr:hypothetical protein Bhyg_11789 [Pseudolycoriella hygida]